MQDLSNLILAIATLIGAITTFYQVVAKTKRDTSGDKDMSVDETEKEIKKLQKKLREERKNDD